MTTTRYESLRSQFLEGARTATAAIDGYEVRYPVSPYSEAPVYVDGRIAGYVGAIVRHGWIIVTPTKDVVRKAPLLDAVREIVAEYAQTQETTK